tara:strand:+ start:211 stop:477 length:267 start_codon:yes stop_codon:yes gene_type:complete
MSKPENSQGITSEAPTIYVYLVSFVAAYIANQSAPILFDFFEKRTQSAGPIFLLFSLISIFAFIFALKLIPETKGRSLEEIAQSWTKK